MKKALVLATALGASPLLAGCLVADVAGAAIGFTSAAVGMIGDSASGTAEDERQQQDMGQLATQSERAPLPPIPSPQ